MRLMIQEEIKKDLVKALKTLRISVEKIHLEHPANPEHGDYATNIALATFKNRPKSLVGETKLPLDWANKIVNAWRLSGLPDYIAKIEVVKPGFINLWFKDEVFGRELERVLEEKEKYGFQAGIGGGKGMMFEFAHPNTHKQFHIGHLRTASLGETLSRIYQALGYQVYRTNYQGDIGLHVAKCLWGVKKLGLTKAKSLKAKIDFLAKAYVKGNQAYEKTEKAKKEIDEINQKLYQKDREVLKLWQQTRRWSLDYFEEIYHHLNTKFDRYYFESEVAESGKEAVLKNLKKGVFQASQGAIIFPGEKFGLHNRVFITSAGLPTYEAKDMALGRLQFSEFDIEKNIHVVGPEQKGYFEVVFKALERVVPETKGKEKHLSYGWVRLKKGKMSSRAGTLVEFNWLLDEVKKEIFKILKDNKDLKKAEKDKVAETVAIGAIKYSILKFSPDTEIQFDIKESINLTGDSGPYLQYTNARCQSVLSKANGKTKKLKDQKTDSQFLSFSVSKFNSEELSLLRTLYQFPEIVQEAGENYAPNLICNFLYDLAQKYNLFYNKHSILKAKNQKSKDFRLTLTAGVSQVLKNGLNLLGIAAPRKM